MDVVDNEKAFAYLKEMGFGEERAREILAGSIGDYCKGLLGTMEEGIKHISGDPNIDPIKVFRKRNDSFNLLGDGKNNK